MPALSCSSIYCDQHNNCGKIAIQKRVSKRHLGSTKYLAFAQYNSMETTLAKTPVLQTQYTDVLQEYEDLSYMKEVKSEEKWDRVSSFLLPHHAILKPEST